MKLGFIGTGNMASAIMGGIIKKQIIPAQEIIGADLFAPGRERAKEQFGIQVTDSNKEVVDKAEVIVLSVKPQFYEDVINEIKGDIKESQIIITIAPGKTLAWLAEKFGKDVKIVRTMPNTPAMVGGRHDGGMPQRAHNGRGDGIYPYAAGVFQPCRDDSGAPDGCGSIHQRKFPGLCLHDD